MKVLKIQKLILHIKNVKLNSKKYNDAFSLIDVIIGVTIFGIFFSSILFGFSSLVKLEIKSKNKIYKSIEAVNEISKKYYIEQDQ